MQITNIILIAQLILLIIIIFILIRKSGDNDQQFIIANTFLKNVCDIYYDSTLKNKIEEIKKTFDLDPQSRTNSIVAFNKQYNELLAESAKQIVRGYISKNCLKTLLTYYDMNSIILTIVFYLKR
jgi:hypothetical protein